MKASDPRAGILAFLGTSLLVLAALVLFARYPAVFNRGREYRAVFGNVAGLNVGDHVRYGGLMVGQVTRMEIDTSSERGIEVYFRVRRKTPVRADTRATITQIGFLGEPYLALEPGSASAPLLSAGGTVPTQDNLSFQEAMTKLATFLDRTDTLFSGLERFAGSRPLERLDRTLARVDTLVLRATSGTDRAFTQLDDVSQRLGAVLERTDRLIVSLDTTVRATGPGLRDTQREALGALREVRSLVLQLRDGLEEGGGVDAVMRNLAITSDNMARLTERLERDPTSVLKSRRVADKPVGPGLRD